GADDPPLLVAHGAVAPRDDALLAGAGEQRRLDLARPAAFAQVAPYVLCRGREAVGRLEPVHPALLLQLGARVTGDLFETAVRAHQPPGEVDLDDEDAGGLDEVVEVAVGAAQLALALAPFELRGRAHGDDLERRLQVP